MRSVVKSLRVPARSGGGLTENLKAMAVAVVGGKQFILHEGDVLTVDNLKKTVGDRFNDFNVLFYGEGEMFSFGTPSLTGSKIEAEVLENFKGRKIDVVKFKAKSRYSKKVGYRPSLTRVKILSIAGGQPGS